MFDRTLRHRSTLLVSRPDEIRHKNDHRSRLRAAPPGTMPTPSAWCAAPA